MSITFYFLLVFFFFFPLFLFSFKSWRWWLCVSLLSGFWILECLFMLLGCTLSDGFFHF